MRITPSYFKEKYDLNGLLQASNLFVVVITLCLYAFKGDNQYINLWTILIFLCFGLQNCLLLLWERNDREPLLLLLMLTVIPFYLLRITTLLYEPWSTVLERFPFTPQNMNSALLFIMPATLAIAAGIKAGRRRKKPRASLPVDKRDARKLYVILMILTVIDLFAVFGLTIPLQGYFSVFFNADIALVMLFVVYALDRDAQPTIMQHYYWIIFFIFILVRTLSGSRGALLTMALSACFASFSLFQTVKIRRLFAVAILTALPLAVLGFSVTTFYRPYRIAKLSGAIDQTPSEMVFEYMQSVTSDSFGENLKILLRPMFDRAGYLDFAADLIANRDKYRIVINPVYYFESVIDNIVTPGFDVFDAPRAANNTISIYNDIPLLKKSDVDTFYQSDMLTIYGENFVLFGEFGAILACFVMGFFAKVILESLNMASDLWYYSSRALFFKLYVLSLWSFGLDWQLGDICFYLVAILSMYFVLKIRIPRLW